MQRKYIVCDAETCVGCELCEFACSAGKTGEFDLDQSRIHLVRLENNLMISVSCRLCEDAPCVAVCPRDALSVSEANGTIQLDQAKCTGCGWCIEACDFGAIVLDPRTKSVAICDLCADEPEPRCIAFCPKKALSLGNATQIAQRARTKVVEQKLLPELNLPEEN